MANTLPMTRPNLIGALKTLGWNPKNEDQLVRAIRDFQRGWALPGQPALIVDGKNGPRTRDAIRQSLARAKAGRPTASKSFSYVEMRCQCGGRYPSCPRIRVHRELFIGLELVRGIDDRPLQIVSGFRCAAHNQKVGGADLSQHVLGAGADIVPKHKTLVVARLRRFSGIGFQGTSGLVRHVDVRHIAGNNTTGGTPARPTTWRYP